MSRRHLLIAVSALTLTASLAAGAGAAGAASSAGSVKAKNAAASAVTYCRAQGGAVQYRTPAYGTNNMENAIGLAGKLGFCRFKSSTDKSMIYVDLTTLSSKKPTLAALAYLEKPAAASNNAPNANPASLYCTQVGGSDSFGGINAAGGGWVSKTDTSNPTLQACVFPDLSSIDSWGLAYHSTGAVRGKDLTKVLRYRPATLPGVFS
jgi:putative hemolysin